MIRFRSIRPVRGADPHPPYSTGSATRTQVDNSKIRRRKRRITVERVIARGLYEAWKAIRDRMAKRAPDIGKVAAHPPSTVADDLRSAERAHGDGDQARAGTLSSAGESTSNPAPASPPTGGDFTADSRRQWFQQQFDEGNLDPDNLAAAKMIVKDEHGRVLMLQSPYEGGRRTLPGGFVDNGERKRERPEDAARREAREELGIAVKIERLLATNRKSPDPEHGRDRPLTDYIYLATIDGSADTGVSAMRFDVDEEEVRGYDFLPRDEAIRSAGRKGIDVSAALEADSSGETIHLVDGRPPSTGSRDDRTDPE